jgi:hypothetical protein
MITTKVHILAVSVLGLALVALPAGAEENAPAADRNFVAKSLEGALAKEAAKVKYERTAEDRHKESLGPIVTYWRSHVTVKAEFVDPATKLKVEVPKMVREADMITLQLWASAPVKGDVSGKALTDDKKEFLKASSPFTTTIKLTAECVLTRVEEKGDVKVRIEITGWKPVLKDTKFENPILNQLRGPIQDAANNKLVEVANPLRGAANAALKRAYNEGKLKLSR